MIYLDEEVIIRLNNLYPSKSGQYLYQVNKDGKPIFSGYTFINVGDSSKEFNISDICAHYRYDCKDFFEYIEAIGVDCSYISEYEIVLYIENQEYRQTEEVAHIYRYPTNTDDNYIINKGAPNSYMPLLQSTRIAAIQSLTNSDAFLFETSFLPHYPKVPAANYGIGFVFISNDNEIPFLNDDGSSSNIPNNSYIALSNFYYSKRNTLDITLGGFSYTRYNIQISNITYNVALPPERMVQVLRFWMNQVQPFFATDIAEEMILNLVQKKTSMVLNIEGGSDVVSLFNQYVTDLIPEDNGKSLFTFGSVTAVPVTKTNRNINYNGLIATPPIKSWNGRTYSAISKTVDNAILIPNTADYIQLSIQNSKGTNLQTTRSEASSGKMDINFQYKPEMEYLEISFNNSQNPLTSKVGYANWDLSSLGLVDGEYYTLEIEYNTNAQNPHTGLHSYAKNWVFGKRTLQTVAILDDCPTRYYLQWQDRYGGIQSQPFTGSITYQESITRSNITNYKNQKIITQNVVQPKWELSSGWIAEEDFPYYESLFISPYLKLYDTQKDVSYLVNITNNSFTEKNWNNTKKLLSLTLNLEAVKPQNILS